MSYEEEQRRLQNLWNDFLSDEEIDDYNRAYEDDATSDEYIPSSENSDTDSETSFQPPAKKLKKKEVVLKSSTAVEEAGPSNRIVDFQHLDSIDQTIEDVINSIPDMDLDNSIYNIETEHFEWLPATGEHLKNICFIETHPGFLTNFYAAYDKTPYDFYKIFVNDSMINMIVST